MIIPGNNPHTLSAFKMAIKNIGGKLYRINNTLNIKKSEESNGDNKRPNVREFKLVNSLSKKMSTVLADDDATSEEDYSGNVSFLEDEDEETENKSPTKSMTIEDIEDMNFANDLNDVDSYMLFSQAEPKGTSGKTIPLMKKTTVSPKPRWTHFLSIPFHANKEFIEKYEFFKKKISEENFSDIDESLFQKNTRLHLTLCLFRIEESKRAEQLNLINKIFSESEEAMKKILDGSPLYIDFDQLEILGSQTKTRVLYTRPHLTNSEKLRDVIDILLNKFIENELITEDMKKSSHLFFNEETERYENEKLHITLMNSTFMIREGISKKSEGGIIKPDSQIVSNSYFHGMKIIKRMKNFSFGIHKVDEIVLNEMRIDSKTDSYRVQDKFKIIH